MTVRRYNPVIDYTSYDDGPRAELNEDDQGDYVAYSDYEALVKELDDARTRIAKMKFAIRQTLRENADEVMP